MYISVVIYVALLCAIFRNTQLYNVSSSSSSSSNANPMEQSALKANTFIMLHL